MLDNDTQTEAASDTEQASDEGTPSQGRSGRRTASRPAGPPTSDSPEQQPANGGSAKNGASSQRAAFGPLFQAPEPTLAPARSRSAEEHNNGEESQKSNTSSKGSSDTTSKKHSDESEDSSESSSGSRSRRRRSRGGRNRRKSSDSSGESAPEKNEKSEKQPADDADKAGSAKAGSAKAGSDKGGSAKADKSSGSSDKADKGSGSSDKDGSAKAGSDKGASSAKKSQKSGDGHADSGGEKAKKSDGGQAAEKEDSQSSSSSSRRRRRRRRSSSGSSGDSAESTSHDDSGDEDSISSVEGSTRIEAKRQRRREGRAAGRKRAPILSEAEFLARRESVNRVMAIRQRGDTTQIAVLEDDVLVEHYVALESQTSIIGNVYLGRVQNVLPSMEAAFIDIGKGRNAVLYAGEVNWDLLAEPDKPRRIEEALKPGQSVVVQVSKDPVGHKGARLTGQVSLPGRYLVFMPNGGNSGISRKLPDTERDRLKGLLKEILPSEAGVIIRTAAEGASEEELTRDVTRLTARWEDIEQKVKGGKSPQVLYEEPDTMLKVVRDLFTEDFSKLVISGGDAWDMVEGYVSHVAPDLTDRLERYDDHATDGEEGSSDEEKSLFAHYRIDEQINKALERKVWLPSGGSLVIDRTEAMTVVDVNTGKFTGSGGNLEETVTKNNLEAAEEIVRQLRLRDIGGIIVIDFIDMVLDTNRDLVLRRLVECLSRDRTRHQVAEVTSLGLVQMTRKRIGTGLVEAFSHACEECHGRGVIIESEPVQPKQNGSHRSQRRSRGSHSNQKSSKSKSDSSKK